MTMRTADIAKVCHAANHAYCAAIGDHSQVPWDDAPEWQRESAWKGVVFGRANPDAPASSSHDEWMAEKLAAGWILGTKKDAELKTHPCLVPFDKLPVTQQRKDHLFSAIVRALTDPVPL